MVFEAERKGVEWVFNCPVNSSRAGYFTSNTKESSPYLSKLKTSEIQGRLLIWLSVHMVKNQSLQTFPSSSRYIAQTSSVNIRDDKIFKLKKQWRIVRCLRDRFWKRWELEYLPTVTRRVSATLQGQ